MQGDPTHIFLGTKDGFDNWGLREGTRTILWRVQPGDDSRAVIPGSLSSMSSLLPIIIGDPSHVFVRSDVTSDYYKMIDESGRLLNWAVNQGDDSRNIVGAVEVIQNPTTLTIQGPPAGSTSSGVIVGPVANPGATVAQTNLGNIGAATNAPVSGVASTALPNAVSTTGAATNTIAATLSPQSAATTSAANVTTARIAGDSSHKYVGTDARGDVYQLFDGVNVIEWAVKVNDDSRNVLAGTVRNLGAPSKMTIAQAGGTTPPAPASSVAGGTGGGGVNGGNSAANETGGFTHPVSRVRGQLPTSWTRVATRPNGDPVFSLVDSSGQTKTFALNGDLQSYFFNDATGTGANVSTGAAVNLTTGASPAADTGKAAFYVGLAAVALKAFVLS